MYSQSIEPFPQHRQSTTADDAVPLQVLPERGGRTRVELEGIGVDVTRQLARRGTGVHLLCARRRASSGRELRGGARM